MKIDEDRHGAVGDFLMVDPTVAYSNHPGNFLLLSYIYKKKPFLLK